MATRKHKTPNYRNPERIILMTGEVTEEMAEHVMGQLLEMDAEPHPDPIVVRIASHGGCGAAARAIYDAIKLARSPVVTEVWGEAASAAALVFQAGAVRRMAPSALLMMHESRGGDENVRGAAELRRHADYLENLNDWQFKVVQERCHYLGAQVANWFAAEKFFSAHEAVEAGLADAIIGA